MKIHFDFGPVQMFTWLNEKQYQLLDFIYFSLQQDERGTN